MGRETSHPLYLWLTGGQARSHCDGFDAHVVGSILALALSEVRDGRPLVEATGLRASEVVELTETVFPHASSLIARLDGGDAPVIAADEACLRDLLTRSATTGSRLEQLLAALVARRAQCPHHLWQDLGLRSRRELSWLMERHFEPLARKNARDMKWKKFLYRVICRDEGLGICVAPSCSECEDYDACFGEENGESFVAAREEVVRSR